ncbi:MAG: molybdopterin-binding protein, partial [Verrucomicrobiota bacterium]
MKIEVINTGTEILLGHVTNTHLGYLARELFSIGERIERQCTVPDGDAIRLALADSLERADVIIVTGGLGPTSDDITREITSELIQ